MSFLRVAVLLGMQGFFFSFFPLPKINTQFQSYQSDLDSLASWCPLLAVVPTDRNLNMFHFDLPPQENRIKTKNVSPHHLLAPKTDNSRQLENSLRSEGFLFVKLLQWSGSPLLPTQAPLCPVSVCMGSPSCPSVRFSQSLCFPSQPRPRTALRATWRVLRKESFKKEGCPVECMEADH